MRIAIVGMLMGVVPLAGCNREPEVEVTNASPDEVAKAVKESGIADELQQPGKWVVRASLVDVKAPGMPPEQLAMMKNMMAKAEPVERCVTAEDLKEATAFLDKNPTGCTFSHYRLGGGKLDGEARCKMGEMSQHMVMKGTYTKDTTETTMTNEITGGPQAMTMTMNVKAQRLGPC
jgi:hypothetical protein